MSSEAVSRLKLGGGDEAYVLDTSTHNGAQVCFCISSTTGQFYGWCPVVFWGGGGSGNSHLPIRIPVFDNGGGVPDIRDYPQVFVVYRSGDRPPVVVGLLSAGGDNDDLQYAADAVVSQDDENTEATSLDLRFQNGGSTLALKDASGNVLVAPKNHAYVGLKGEGELRVVRDGDDSGRVPLADPLLSHIEEIRTVLEQLITWLKTAVAPSTGGTLTPAFFSEAPSPVDTRTIKAAAVKVPSAAEIDFTPDF